MKITFFLICYCFYFGSTVAQVNSNHKISIDSALGSFKENFPQEKVLLQTDKDAYAWGETIWMKAWCTMDGLPSYLSRILYVDLVNETGDVVYKKMYQLDSLGSTPVDFDLAEDITSGNYVIQAYTLWMLNFPDFITKKEIFIYGSNYKFGAAKKIKKGVQMMSFPEGGDLIEDVENRVAFKINSEEGYPLNLKGNITSPEGKEVVTFTAEHDGMGFYLFTPEKGKAYMANITAGNGAVSQFKLPLAKEGVTMKADNSNANRVVVLLNRSETNKEKYTKLKIVAQINSQIVFAQPINLDEGMAAAINKKNLPGGILQITIFTEDDIPLCERIVFIENYKVQKPQLNVDALKTTARGLNRISMPSFPNKTSLLFSVTDASNGVDSSAADNVISSMLLRSDLKGFINNPGYYVKNKSATTLRHLDLLMMTQGWRRFEWKKILNNEFPTVKYPVESAMSFRGTVTKSDRTELVKTGFVSFIIKTSDSATILAEAKLTDKGEFLLSDINFRNKADISYMGTDDKKNKYIVDVKLNPTHIDSLKKSNYRFYVNNDTLDMANSKNDLAIYFLNKLKSLDTTGKGYLGNVTVKAKRLSPVDSLNKEYADGPFLMGKGINPKEFKNYRTVWQIIQAAVPGITVSGNPLDPDVAFNRYQGLNAFSDNTAASSDENPGIVLESSGIAYFLNGVNVSKDIINTLSVDDVAFIKVLKTEATVLGATQGAIALYTNQGKVISNAAYDKSYTHFTKEGYALAKQFYTTDYQLDPSLNKNSQDKRYLLYWNPKPMPAKDGKYHVTFFNNDSAKKFRIVVQGIDNTGGLIFQEKILE